VRELSFQPIIHSSLLIERISRSPSFLWKRLNKGTKVYRIPKGIADIMLCLSPIAAAGFVWASPTPFREDFPCVGAAERVSDFGRGFTPGSCS